MEEKYSKRLFGAHVSTAGGYSKALERVSDMGGNCLQIFSTSPRTWTPPSLNIESSNQFIDVKNKLKVDPAYFHASYLINLSDQERVGDFSKKMLIAELNLASKMNIKGSIIHLGSFKDGGGLDKFDSSVPQYKVLLKNINDILDQIPKDVLFIIENSGTRKIGKNIEEIAGIIKEIKDDRVRICFDTCHLHAAGYDLSSKEKLDDFLKKVDTLVGLEKIELFHLNDSRDEFGSLRDRHDNIGKGKIGLDEFKLIINHPKLKKVPFILEVPGFDDNGPDKDNLDILKSLVE